MLDPRDLAAEVRRQVLPPRPIGLRLEHLSRWEVAALLAYSPEQIDELQLQGLPNERNSHGVYYVWGEVIHWYVAYESERQASHSQRKGPKKRKRKPRAVKHGPPALR